MRRSIRGGGEALGAGRASMADCAKRGRGGLTMFPADTTFLPGATA